MEHLKALIRDVPDFPLPGILFRDVTPLLRDPAGLKQVVDAFADRYVGRGVQVVAGIESRGFLFGAPLALALGVGFVPIRKLGKLPAEKISREYDDLLATGGTARAAAALIEELGGEIAEVAFVIELAFLNGRSALEGYPVHALMEY
jgi:adenine phosphoribosyltransferase